MSKAIVRSAVARDAERLLEIYSYYVENTAVTFEYVTPSPEEFRARIKSISEKHPYLVIEEDGKVLGYAYADVFIGRAAYARSCKTTVYVDKNARKRGLGRMICTELENRLREAGFLNLYACVAYPRGADCFLTADSAEFHAHIGYRKVGEFHCCGYKFGRWYDMIWMEKLIGEHLEKQPPANPVPAANSSGI